MDYVKGGIILVSVIQFILGTLLMIVTRVATFKSNLQKTAAEVDATGVRLWWLYGLPFVVVGAVGFVAPKRQTFMGWYLILNIIGLVLALCWFAEIIHTLTLAPQCTASSGDYYRPHSPECSTFGYVMGLTVGTGLGVLSFIAGIVTTARNISDDNTMEVQNGGYMDSQQFNSIDPQNITPYSAQPIPPPCYVPSQPATELEKTTV